MDLQAHPSQQELLLRICLEATRKEGGRPPVYQYVDLELRRIGVDSPDECLEGIGSELIVFDRPLQADSKLELPVRGVLATDPNAREIHHGFLKVVRALYDRLEREEMLSSAQAQPVVAHAHELWSPRLGPNAECRMVGLLLELEQIGKVEWTGDPASPWSIEIDFRIRRFGAITNLADYLRIRYPEDD